MASAVQAFAGTTGRFGRAPHVWKRIKPNGPSWPQNTAEACLVVPALVGLSRHDSENLLIAAGWTIGR
jgi:hypothetical protein